MTKPAALLQTRNTITATDHQQGDKVFLQASQNNPGNLFWSVIQLDFVFKRKLYINHCVKTNQFLHIFPYSLLCCCLFLVKFSYKSVAI